MAAIADPIFSVGFRDHHGLKGAYHTPMPENSKGTVTYLCECGKKWVFTRAEINVDTSQSCKCGRTIVVNREWIYSTKKK